MEALDFAREVWKEFGLNDSFGAGMTLTVDGVVTKQHGKLTNTDDLKEMPDSIVHYEADRLHVINNNGKHDITALKAEIIRLDKR